MSNENKILYEPRVYNLLDFRSWRDKRELELSPRFQRRSVWPRKAQSFLIDTIVKRLPMPHIYVREILHVNPVKSVREVVDGQQRLRTILSFIDGDFTMQRVHNSEYAGLHFSELPVDIQHRILQYPVTVAVLHNASDAEIIEIFSRLNANSLPLNAQEKLNARYFGAFKQAVYRVGGKYIEFWRDSGILTDTRIARMGEAELTGELFALLMLGRNDKKSALEALYRQFDEEYPLEQRTEQRFDQAIGFIYALFDGKLSKSRYRSRPLFYTLFEIVDDHLQQTPRKDSALFAVALMRAIETTEAWLELREETDEEEIGRISRLALSWIRAAGQATDNASSRQTRYEILSQLTNTF